MSTVDWILVDQALPPSAVIVLVLRGPMGDPWKTDVAIYNNDRWWGLSPAGARPIGDVSAWASLPGVADA